MYMSNQALRRVDYVGEIFCIEFLGVRVHELGKVLGKRWTVDDTLDRTEAIGFNRRAGEESKVLAGCSHHNGIFHEMVSTPWSKSGGGWVRNTYHSQEVWSKIDK